MGIREHFLKLAQDMWGIPYRWGGGDPSGFDCSGFVIECLQSVGLFPLKKDETADGLMLRFSHLVIPFPVSGALVFSLNEKGHAVHVEICVDDRVKIGSSGGGSRTKTVNDAWRQRAYIKTRPLTKRKNQVFVYPFAWK